jgi:hypothetical protein
VVSHTNSLAVDVDRLTEGEGDKRGKQPRKTRALHSRVKEGLQAAGTRQEMTMCQKWKERNGDKEGRGKRLAQATWLAMLAIYLTLAFGHTESFSGRFVSW